MPTEKRLPTHFKQTPAQQFEVLDYQAYPWGYDANEEILSVGINTQDLHNTELVTHYAVDFPYSHFGFDEHLVDNGIEVLGTEIKFVFTDEQLRALSAAERKTYDEDRGLTLGTSFLLLLDPLKKQFHTTR